jgi:hypothetical protein
MCEEDIKFATQGWRRDGFLLGQPLFFVGVAVAAVAGGGYGAGREWCRENLPEMENGNF